MINNQFIQNLADSVKRITGADFYVFDQNGEKTASTFNREHGVPDIIPFKDSGAKEFTTSEFFFFRTDEKDDACFVAAAKSPNADVYGRLLALQISALVSYTKDKNDCAEFIRALLLEKMLPVDVALRSKKLRVSQDTPRAMYLIENNFNETMNAHDILRNMYPVKNKDIITSLTNEHIIAVKELAALENADETAKVIFDTLSAEAMSRFHITVYAPVLSLADLPAAYKESVKALAIGKIFEPEKYIINCSRLGIGRVIYNLPEEVREAFLSEVLPDTVISHLSEEDMLTINKFFDNNLNISETSRQLYIHRNTLVYRLDKLQRITGLDIRRFADASLFRFALLAWIKNNK